MNASLDEKLRRVEWGEYRLGDLFEITTSKSADKGNLKISSFPTQDCQFQFIGRTSANNGIQGYVGYLGYKPNPQNTFSVIQIGENLSQFRNREWYASQNIFLLVPSQEGFVKNQNFITACINKVLTKYSGGYTSYPTIPVLRNEQITLPIKNGKIDFDFMESFVAELEAQRVAELEAQRVAELEAYLSVTGLKDTRLSFEEEQALKNYENISFVDYKLTDIFDIKNTGNILSKDIVENSGIVPYLCASSENNAVSSYIAYDNKYKSKGNCIFIGGKTFVVTYQEKDFFSNDSHNIALYLKNSIYRTKLTQMYLATCVYKSLCNKYSWGDSISNKKAQRDYVSLPSKDGKVDFECMALLISAMHKIVIKDVVAYADRKIAATQAIVTQNISE